MLENVCGIIKAELDANKLLQCHVIYILVESLQCYRVSGYSKFLAKSILKNAPGS